MHLVCVGGSDAGIAAGLRARELDAKVEVSVVLDDAYPNYSICGLPFLLSGEVEQTVDLAHRTAADLEAAGLSLRTNTRATGVDVTGQAVEVVDGGGRPDRIPYDRLVIGTGARPVRPGAPGLDLPGVHVLHRMGDALALADRLVGARDAVVVGAGYIGTEMADALTVRGLEVTLVERLPAVMTTMDPDLGAMVGDVLAGHGVAVRPRTTVEEVTASAGRLRMRGTPDLDVTTDVVLVAVGVRPAAELAIDAGAQTGAGGAITVDRGMRTGVPDVFAAGDCAVTWHRLLERDVWLPLGSTAHKQGRVAGENAVGGDRRFAGTLGTQVVKVFDAAVARTGLLAGEARDAGFDPVVTDVEIDDHKAYYPGATRLRVRLVGDRSTRRLLGGQLVGAASAQVAKRTDIVAAAISAAWSFDVLEDLDLSYTPPFSSPYDPLEVAGHALAAQA